MLSACTTRRPPKPAPPPEPAHLRLSQFESVPGWHSDALIEAWPAFLKSCHRTPSSARQTICSRANALAPSTSDEVRGFFETHFLPYQVIDSAGYSEGLITGYYEPLLFGSRIPTERYRYPLYKKPDNLANLASTSAEPLSRAHIDGPMQPLKGYELLWVDDAIDLFFLHIQGSGKVLLEESNEIVSVGYAGQNGYPYVAIGKLLIEDGELSRESVNMPNIKAWLRNNPEKATNLLNRNPSYIFFRELPAGLSGPLGALGVPLTGGRSVAVDPAFIPLGAPVFLDTTWPGTASPLQRLTIAQDTGGAIKGAVRADFFWGFGAQAEDYAGRMKETGRIWVLLPQ